MLTNVYVDGFNLYYGCLRRSPYKWLDLGELCAKLLPGNQIHRIHYFTARIKARPSDPDAPNRQEAYLAALGSVPALSLHYGHFLTSRATMLLVSPPAGASPFVRVHKTEEKGSDVNLATWMLTDAFERDCEQVVLVTNDSDLAEPMRIAAQRQGMPVGLIKPPSPQGEPGAPEPAPGLRQGDPAGRARQQPVPRSGAGREPDTASAGDLVNPGR